MRSFGYTRFLMPINHCLQSLAMGLFNVPRSLLLSACLSFLIQGSVQAQSFFNRSYSDLNQASEFHGDFIDILQRGKLRILLPRDFTSVSYLPRRRSPLAEQQRIAEEFALSHGLIPELVLVDNFAKLIPALEAGKGDIIINNLTINSQRLEKIAFSVPVDHVYEQVIVRADDASIKQVSDLNGKKVMVNKDSTFWHALQWLKANSYPEIEITGTPDGIAREKLLDYLAEGKIDATIMDDNLARIYASYRDDFKVATNFSSQRDIAWGVRKNAPQLVSEINRYLQLEYQVENRDERFVGDLEEIKKRRVLRVVLPNNAASYFLYRGELQGFEYELIREFADFHGLRLEVIVPSAEYVLSDWLLEGKADLALGFIEPDEQLRVQGVGFSEPYHYTRRHIAVNKRDPAKSWAEMKDYTVLIPERGANEPQLVDLKSQGAGFGLQVSETSVDAEQMHDWVAEGREKAALVKEHDLNIELAKSTAVRSAIVLDDEVAHAIALRAQNSALKGALDIFVKGMYRSEFYNLIYSKYFESKRSIKRLSEGRVTDALQGQISPFDDLVQKYANLYGFDWRLITAQMFQESRFNPKAKSPAGARGLMQLMPRTAKSMGVEKVNDPGHSILGGIKYLDWLRDRFSQELPISERLWFTLASYNAGAGHVHDARRLAEQLGNDPDRWFNHTEKAMMLLSKKEFSKKARYGFVNGAEPVNYVHEIKNRFEAYVSFSGQQTGIQDFDPVVALMKGSSALSANFLLSPSGRCPDRQLRLVTGVCPLR